MTRLILPNSSSGTSLVTKSQTLSANNTTAATAIFGVTGCVEIQGIWAIVTTVIGANHTAGLYQTNDQTATVAITASGATLSGLAAGTTIIKKGLAAAALTLLDNAAGRVSEPTTLETMVASPFIVLKKTGAATNIEYKYTTTDTPTSGVLKHYVEWRPRSDDGAVVAL